MNKKSPIIYPILLLLLTLSCGYSFLPLFYNNNYKKIYIHVTENPTLRHRHELTLTNYIINCILSRTNYKIVNNKKNADLILSSTILRYETPAMLENVNDEVVQSRLVVSLKVSLLDPQTGSLINKNSFYINTVSADIIGARNQSEDSAKTEVFEYLAQWVVSLLEKGN